MVVDTRPDELVKITETNQYGYKSFALGEFTFSRDEYFAYVKWPTGDHVSSSTDNALRPSTDICASLFSTLWRY